VDNVDLIFAGPYSPVVEIDEDSHSRFMGDSSRSRHGNITDDHEDNEWRRDRYCQPRNSVLSLVSEFVIKCTAKLQEINKKDRQEKSLELLDLKCSFKLVDIAHSLIKMASYDQVSFMFNQILRLCGLKVRP